MAVSLISNVKIITSGVAPTTANLMPGQAAFGKITADGAYHLYGNTGESSGTGEVVDIIMSTLGAQEAATLESVLTSGNTTKLDIVFQNNEGQTLVTVGPTGLLIGTTSVTEAGFKDNGEPVLSSNPSLTLTTIQATKMRTLLDTYSKAEVDAKLSSVLVFKGSVNAFADLPTDANVGDVYNVKTSGGTDIYGNPIKAGDNVVYVAANGDTPAGWDVLSGVVDLSNYYTKSEVEDLGYQTASDVEGILTAENVVKDANYVHTDNNYTTADKNKVAKILTNGTGSKVLTDNGTYEELSISVVSI